MKNAKILSPVIGDQMPLVQHLHSVKRTKSYPVIFYSRKKYSESEEEE